MSETLDRVDELSRTLRSPGSGCRLLGMYRPFFFFLLLQMAVSALVVLTFRSIESRFQAGLVAGSFFIVLGLLVVGYGLKVPAFRRTGTFVLGCIHLGMIAVPMVAFRLANADLEFVQVRIWGLPGPVFHGLSEVFYLIWMLATLSEGIWRWLKVRRQARA